MERKKLSPEEIQVLREKAEKERSTHAETMKNIKAVTMSPQLQMSTVMSSYERGRKDEILALLQAHTSDNRKYELSSEVMLFIYEHGDQLPDEKEFMLQNNHLPIELEKRIFDDKLPPFIPCVADKMMYPRFSSDAEVYMIKETLKACLEVNKLTNELGFLCRYTANYKFSSWAEFALMDFLSEPEEYNSSIKELALSDLIFVQGGYSVADTLRFFVLGYLILYQNLSDEALLRLIHSGDHELIMYYITHSLSIISAPKAVNALLDRADEEEVAAYYERWAKEE